MQKNPLRITYQFNHCKLLQLQIHPFQTFVRRNTEGFFGIYIDTAVFLKALTKYIQEKKQNKVDKCPGKQKVAQFIEIEDEAATRTGDDNV